jgi:hypothetical protein
MSVVTQTLFVMHGLVSRTWRARVLSVMLSVPCTIVSDDWVYIRSISAVMYSFFSFVS